MAINSYPFTFQKEIGTIQLIAEIDVVISPKQVFKYTKNMLPEPPGVFSTQLNIHMQDETLDASDIVAIDAAIVSHSPSPTDAVLKSQQDAAISAGYDQFKIDFANFELSFESNPDDIAKLKANQLALKDIFADFVRLVYPFV